MLCQAQEREVVAMCRAGAMRRAGAMCRAGAPEDAMAAGLVVCDDD
jgi:hypothetical protein